MKQPGDSKRSASGNDAALSTVNFDIIRYANCWEDAGMLLRAFEDQPAQHIAIVASAGDNALACLASSPTSVLAFDISRPQLYLSELKQQAYAMLEYDELLLLLCVSPGGKAQRTQLLEHVSIKLSAGCRAYWQQNRHIVANGLIHGGKFERYFRVFREWLLPLVHSKATIAALFAIKSPRDLETFYHRRWNNLRWKLLMQIFFSRFVMGRAGRDPQFLKQVQIPVADYIRRQTEAHLQSPVAMGNHFLQYVFTGNFSTLRPHFLQPEYYPIIRSNIGRMTLRQASADEIVNMRIYDTLCLSNIFEYYPQQQFEDTVRAWENELEAGTRLLFWNLMVPRSFSRIAPAAYESLPVDRIRDAGFFYSAFLNEQRR